MALNRSMREVLTAGRQAIFLVATEPRAARPEKPAAGATPAQGSWRCQSAAMKRSPGGRVLGLPRALAAARKSLAQSNKPRRRVHATKAVNPSVGS